MFFSLILWYVKPKESKDLKNLFYIRQDDVTLLLLLIIKINRQTSVKIVDLI